MEYIKQKKNDEEYLAHYGVMGMKWGVHRYRDKNGKITPKGEAKFQKVASSPMQTKIHTARALRVHTRNRNEATRKSRAYIKESQSQYNKADKHVWKSEAAQSKGDTQAFNKHQGKAWQHMAKSYTAEEKGKEFVSKAAYHNRKLSEINSGTIKAGRDFIVQADNNVYPLLIPVPGGAVVGIGRTREYQYIEKDKKRK